MIDIDHRFREADRLPTRDLWPDISAREPQAVPAHRSAVPTLVIALVVAAVGMTFAGWVFLRGRSSRPGGLRGVANGSEFAASDIFVIGSDGGGLRRLTHNTGMDQSIDPAWSPDGRLIAFSAARFDGRRLHPYAVYVMNTDGRSLRQVTSCDAEACQHNGGDLIPAWSPDGSRIVFRRGGDLYVVNVRTAAVQLLFDCPDHTPGACNAITSAWSPDGRTIAFVRTTLSPDRVELVSMGADGTGLRTLVSRAAGDDILQPAWSPDGRYLTFTTTRGSPLRSSIWVMRPDGTGLREVRADAGFTCCAAWQPILDS